MGPHYLTVWVFLSFFICTVQPVYAESVTIDGVTINYDLAEEIVTDKYQQDFMNIYKRKWLESHSDSMQSITHEKSLKCQKNLPQEAQEFYNDLYKVMYGKGRPRDSKMKFLWIPWKDLDLLKLGPRGLAVYPVTPTYIMGVTTLDPKFFSKENSEAYYNPLNYFYVYQEPENRQLYFVLPCLTDKAIRRFEKGIGVGESSNH